LQSSASRISDISGLATRLPSRYTAFVEHDIKHILIGRDAIATRVREVAGEIMRDLEDEPLPASSGGSSSAPGAAKSATGREITLVPILTGSIIFVADLIRHLPYYMQIRMMSVTSYPGTATASQGAHIKPHLTDLPPDLTGCHVLVVDDILDSGNTLSMVRAELEKRNPQTLRTCVLLRKQRSIARPIDVDYACFDVPDEFVVGYGLDYNDRYRNLPDVVTLHDHVIQSK